jgi:hypothetical protein
MAISPPRVFALVLAAACALPGCLITPNTALLDEAGVGSDAGVDVRVDAGPDGPAVDLPLPDAPTEAAPDLGPNPDTGPGLGKGNARLLYGETGDKLLTRTWDSKAGTWTAAKPAFTVSKAVQWTMNKVSPVATGDEAAMVLTGDLNGIYLHALQRTGTSTWSEPWSHTDVLNSYMDKRGLDLEYESISGDLLVVYTKNTLTPFYRTRSSGTWSGEKPLPLNDGTGPYPDPNDGTVLWVELVTRPGTDEISLVYADSLATLVLITWDGKQWDLSSTTQLETSLKKNPITKAVHQRVFDAAYEGKSGDLLVAWGYNGDGFKSKVRSGFSSTWDNVKTVQLVSGKVDFVDLAGHPLTDKIAGVFLDLGEGNERLGLATWDGTDWVNDSEYDNARDVNDQAQGDFTGGVAWLDPNVAVCVYADDQVAAISWYRWESLKGWTQMPYTPVLNLGYTESIQLSSVPGQNEVLALISDDKNRLWAAAYTGGTTWNVANNGQPLSTTLTTTFTMPFSFDIAAK